MQLTGSQVIIECLKEQGVDTVFGYPGGAILNVYDELYKHPEIKHVLTSHEQGASHAADGYARSTGKVGVCLATSGPGATNLVTGISTAYMDSIPIVAITCNVGVSLLGKDSFHSSASRRVRWLLPNAARKTDSRMFVLPAAFAPTMTLSPFAGSNRSSV